MKMNRLVRLVLVVAITVLATLPMPSGAITLCCARCNSQWEQCDQGCGSDFNCLTACDIGYVQCTQGCSGPACPA